MKVAFLEPKGLGQLVVANVAGHLARVPCQKVLGSNPPRRGALVYANRLLRMSFTNVGKHPLDFSMRFLLMFSVAAGGIHLRDNFS
jgi:hypothetical protein